MVSGRAEGIRNNKIKNIEEIYTVKQTSKRGYLISLYYFEVT